SIWRSSSGAGADRSLRRNPYTSRRGNRDPQAGARRRDAGISADGQRYNCLKGARRRRRSGRRLRMTTGAFDPTREQADQAFEPFADEKAAEIAARSPLELFWRRIRDDKVALTAAGFIVFLVLCALLAPLIVKLVG